MRMIAPILTALMVMSAPPMSVGDITICALTEKVTGSSSQSGVSFTFTGSYPRFSGIGDKGAQTELNADIKEWMQKALADTKAAAAVMSSDDRSDQRQAEGIYGYEVKRNQGGLVSLLITQYLYSGGANGLETVEGLTFLSGSGRRLTLEDLFTNPEQGLDEINEEVRRQLTERDLERQLLVSDPAVGTNQTFYLTDKTLVVVVPPLTWFAHVMGSVEFEIPLEQLSGRSDFLNVC